LVKSTRIREDVGDAIHRPSRREPPHFDGREPLRPDWRWVCRDAPRRPAYRRRRIFPLPEQLARWLGADTVIEAVPISRDTPDWTLGSFWAHPERVLDPQARAGTSGFARMSAEVVARVVEDVRRDLENGTWDERHGHLRDLAEYDAGLRLVTHSPS
jgi:hypothetical protein